MNTNISNLIHQYKTDQQSVFNTWFINNEDGLSSLFQKDTPIVVSIICLFFYSCRPTDNQAVIAANFYDKSGL